MSLFFRSLVSGEDSGCISGSILLGLRGALYSVGGTGNRNPRGFNECNVVIGAVLPGRRRMTWSQLQFFRKRNRTPHKEVQQDDSLNVKDFWRADFLPNPLLQSCSLAEP